MPARAIPYRRAAVVVPLLLIAVIAWWATRAGSEAAPSAAPPAAAKAAKAQAGKVAFDALSDGATTLPLISFSAGGTNSVPTGGGAAGKFVPDEPALVIDAAAVDPLLLRAAATGVHLRSATVTLFRPGTTKRQEVWRFDDVTITAMRTKQSGSAKPPRVSLGLGYGAVTVTAYSAGGAVASTFCFDVDASGAC